MIVSTIGMAEFDYLAKNSKHMDVKNCKNCQLKSDLQRVCPSCTDICSSWCGRVFMEVSFTFRPFPSNDDLCVKHLGFWWVFLQVFRHRAGSTPPFWEAWKFWKNQWGWKSYLPPSSNHLKLHSWNFSYFMLLNVFLLLSNHSCKGWNILKRLPFKIFDMIPKCFYPGPNFVPEWTALFG